MRPATLLTQSFLLVSSVVAVPAVLQPRKDLAKGCTYITNLESDVSALAGDVKTLTSPDIISDIELVISQTVKLTEDLFNLGAALSCVGLKTKREGLSSANEISILERSHILTSACGTAKAVEAEIISLTDALNALLGLPALDPAVVAEIEKFLLLPLEPLLPLIGCS